MTALRALPDLDYLALYPTQPNPAFRHVSGSDMLLFHVLRVGPTLAKRIRDLQLVDPEHSPAVVYSGYETLKLRHVKNGESAYRYRYLGEEDVA